MDGKFGGNDNDEEDVFDFGHLGHAVCFRFGRLWPGGRR